MYIGWRKAEEGDYATAYRCYEYMNDVISEVNELSYAQTPPELQLLRHFEGEAEGTVKQFPVNENMVMSMELRTAYQETSDAFNMTLTKIPKTLDINLDYKLDQYHLNNIIKELPHAMVLSTGRCGTMSMYRLFQQTHYIPYHSYFFQPSVSYRYEMMCQHLEGNHGDRTPANEWVKTRAAEWLGSVSQNRPMMGVNHLDTIFAPVFASLHPKSKFIYLRRDHKKVFESMYSKDQWSRTQIQPIHYQFDPFKWCYPGYDIPYLITWYIKFTEVFSRAFGEKMGDRFIELSADKLFSQDKEEIKRLEDFTEIKVPENHFSVPYNQKAHKNAGSKKQIKEGLELFDDYYGRL